MRRQKRESMGHVECQIRKLSQLEWMIIENDGIILGKEWTIKIANNDEPVMLPLGEVITKEEEKNGLFQVN
jgi:hypothetical protein